MTLSLKSHKNEMIENKSKSQFCRVKYPYFIFISTHLGRRFSFGTIKLLLKVSFAKFSVLVATV